MKLIIVIAFAILLNIHLAKPITQSTTLRSSANTIPKILWTYWDSGYQGAQLFTKLCINNMKFYATKSGWEFKFLTRQNLTLFISQQSQQRMKKMIETSKNQITIQNKVDIYRLFLLYENGGMWLDTNSFLVNELTWIQNIDKQTTAFNRISSDPDLITFTYDALFGGNKTRVINAETGDQVYLFPGIEIWSFITKPYSKFLADIIENLQYSLAIPRVDIDQQNKKNGCLYADENDIYFFTSNYQFQTVLQKKQKQIQKHPEKYITKYAVDYYKIWSIDALSSALAISQFSDWKIASIVKTLFYDSLETFSLRHKTQTKFVKFSYHFYPQINALLPYVQFLTCLKVTEQISTQSIIYKYLFEPSKQMSEVQAIINVNKQNKCQIFKLNQYLNIIIISLLIFFSIISINYLLFNLISAAGNFSNSQSKQIDNNDD